MNPLLYGHNLEERIVAVQQIDDGTMRLHFRGKDGLSSRDERFYPFFYLTDGRYLDDFERKRWVKKLEGHLSYQYLCAFEEWPAMWDAVRHVLETHNRESLTKADSYADLDTLYLNTDPVTQFLMQTGRTLFKGMTFEELHRIQLDIETYTSPPHRFSNPSRPGDRIILIALSDNLGWSHVIDGKKHSEKEMLAELAKILSEKDPDVIEGHNVIGFDLSYILKRAELNELTLPLGRGKALPKVYEGRTPYGEIPFETTAIEIPGRQIIDTLLLVQGYDSVKRGMESHSLKYAAKYFGLTSPDRTYIEGDKISWHWDHDPEPLKAYALDDVNEVRLLSEHLSETPFYLTRIVPGNYGHVARMGSAAKIESLMVREYIRLKHSLPHPQEGAQTSGGYTNVFQVGVLGPIIHADIESLYPSIMVTKEIAPASDTNKVFLSLLKELTATRLEAKRTARRLKDPVKKSRQEAMQSSLKILINSFYGYLGYNRALFNDYKAADAVTQTGQQMLKQMIDHVEKRGGKVVEVDTDGVFFVPPEDVEGEERELAFVQELSDVMPEGITVALDGRYRKMMSYKKKNYALLAYDERIRVKGSSLISRSMERFARTYIHSCIDYLLNNDIEAIHKLYGEQREAIQGHKLAVAEFARVETLRDSLEQYEQQVATGKRNRSAAYEVALASGKPYRVGDRVAYYITGSDPNARSFDNCKSAEEWDPNFPDENVPYYLRRLDEYSEKFTDFFQPQDFRAIFSAEELFSFDPRGIVPLVTPVPAEPSDSPQDSPPRQFGIWIDA